MSNQWRRVAAALDNPDRRRVYAEAVLGLSGEPSTRREKSLAALREAGLLDAAGAPIADAFARLLAETAPVTRQGLERWVTAGVITEWPSRPADRDELLAWVLERAAEPGESLGERELTERLAALGHDPVALRRALVDAELVTRTIDGSTYRRS